MEIITDPAVVGGFVIPRLPKISQRTFEGRMDAFSALGYTDNGRMVVGVLFSDHSPILRGVHVHMALEIPPGNTGAILRTAFGHAMTYTFDNLKCVRVTAHVPKRHDKMRKAITILGFKEEGCMRHGFLIDDCIIYGLTKRDCQKWMLHTGRNAANLSATGGN